MSLQILKTVCNTCQHLMVSTHRELWWRTQRSGEIGVCSCVEGRMIDLGAQNEDTRSRKPLHCVLFTDWNYLLGPVPWSAVSDQNAIWIWKAKKSQFRSTVDYQSPDGKTYVFHQTQLHSGWKKGEWLSKETMKEDCECFPFRVSVNSWRMDDRQ